MVIWVKAEAMALRIVEKWVEVVTLGISENLKSNLVQGHDLEKPYSLQEL